MRLCPYCRYPTRNIPARKIPVVPAIIAIVFLAAMIFGATIIAMSHIRNRSESDGEAALHLDGTWATESPTFNDEHITYVFDGDAFTSITERFLFDANPEVISSFVDFHRNYHGALVDSEYLGDGNYFIHITTSGTFTLEGHLILLIKGDGLLVPFSFDWDGTAIYIDGYRFVRQAPSLCPIQ